jgi:hypothetical protein
MSELEGQGIVSFVNGSPLVQVRQVDDEGNVVYGFQVHPDAAREMAQNFIEAAANAVYEAALFAWLKETFPEDGETMAARMISGIRDYRADRWGLPTRPENWCTDQNQD